MSGYLSGSVDVSGTLRWQGTTSHKIWNFNVTFIRAMLFPINHMTCSVKGDFSLMSNESGRN